MNELSDKAQYAGLRLTWRYLYWNIQKFLKHLYYIFDKKFTKNRMIAGQIRKENRILPGTIYSAKADEICRIVR